MKKAIAIILSAIILCTCTACSSAGKDSSSSTSEKSSSDSSEATTETTQPETKPETTYIADNDSLKEAFSNLESADFSGIVYAERDGKPAAVYTGGKLYNDKEITIDTPMPIGSVSKQFCAASIMKLQEQGKLSVNDTLDKYYPEYKEAGRITLHNMLSNRSGIPNLDENTPLNEITYEHNDKENTEILLKWVFSQPLLFEPDSEYRYSNYNFLLLGNIVEKLSGKTYIEFLRENILKPLGMDHTGSVDELKDSPDWAKEFSYEPSDFIPVGIMPGLCKGAGDIISTAADMTKWLHALPEGKVVNEESYKAMTTDYTNTTDHYGYGLMTEMSSGIGHFGLTGHFTACDYFCVDEKLTLFMAANTGGQSTIVNNFYTISNALRG